VILGPALQQLLSALSQVPNEKKSEYESRLQAELTVLANITQSWKNRVSMLGQSVWWSDPRRRYNVWLTSTPEGRVIGAGPADNEIYAGNFRMPIDGQFVARTLDEFEPAHGKPTLAQLFGCDLPNCPRS
jgi:hypothetical protein